MAEETLEQLVKNLGPEIPAYEACNPNKAENTFKQLRDLDYLKKVLINGTDLKSVEMYRSIVEADVDKKMKESGCSKVTSKKFKERYYNKYHYIKYENCHIMYALYGKTSAYTITFMERIVTSRGSLYIIAPNDRDTALIHHHVFERYEERAGVVSNDRLEAIKWLLKEFNHTKTEVLPARPEHGFFLEDTYSFLASGMLLGNVVRGMSFFKTYIPTDMMDKYQDSMHECAWSSITESIKKRKRNAPIV